MDNMSSQRRPRRFFRSSEPKPLLRPPTKFDAVISLPMTRGVQTDPLLMRTQKNVGQAKKRKSFITEFYQDMVARESMEPMTMAMTIGCQTQLEQFVQVARNGYDDSNSEDHNAINDGVYRIVSKERQTA